MIWFYRAAGNWLAGLLRASAVTPNQLTITSGVLAILSMLIFVNLGEKGRFDAWAIVLLLGTQLALVLDYTDGSLARLRNTVSDLGKFLDSFLDSLKAMVLLFVVFLMADSTESSMLAFLVTLLLAIDQRDKRNSLVAPASSGKAEAKSMARSLGRPSFVSLVIRVVLGFSLANFYLMLTLWLVTGLVGFPLLLLLGGVISIARNVRSALKTALASEAAGS